MMLSNRRQKLAAASTYLLQAFHHRPGLDTIIHELPPAEECLVAEARGTLNFTNDVHIASMHTWPVNAPPTVLQSARDKNMFHELSNSV